MSVRALRNVFSFACMLGAFLLQTAVLPAFGCTAVAPDVLLAALLVITVQHGLPAAMALGAGFGVVMDVLYTDGIGLYALSYVLAGGFFHLWGARFQKDRFLPQAAALPVAQLGKELLHLAVLYLSRHALPAGSAVWGRILLCMGLTLLCALPMWLLLNLFYERMRHREIRGY